MHQKSQIHLFAETCLIVLFQQSFELPQLAGPGVTGVVAGVLFFLHENWIYAVKKTRRSDLQYMTAGWFVAKNTKGAMRVS